MFIVDSHAHNKQGEPAYNGTAVLLKFHDLTRAAKYIFNSYFDKLSDTLIQYDIQFLKIDKSGIDELTITRVVNSLCKNSRKRDVLIDTTSMSALLCDIKIKKCKVREANILQSSCVQAFQKKIYEGPFYYCVVCNRSLYRKFVTHYKNQYDANVVTDVFSSDGKKYICKTCDNSLKKKKVPCQAVCNKLHIEDVPIQLSCLNKLELVLISKRILFKKIAIMSKGQMPKLKVQFCNIPVTSDETVKVLPRGASSTGVVLVKLKRKLKHQGHVYFEPVSPGRIKNALLFLTNNNEFYADVDIDFNRLSSQYFDLNEEKIDFEISNVLANTSPNEELEIEIEHQCERNIENNNEDPLNEFRHGVSQSILIPSYLSDELIEIAPGGR